MQGDIKMTNFDFLKKYEQFNSFADLAITAEKLLSTDPNSSMAASRKTLEFIIKWMYSVDEDLVADDQDNLFALMKTDDFESIVDQEILDKMHYIRKYGNDAVHKNVNFEKEQAALCLDHLFSVVDFIIYCYGDEYVERIFDRSLLNIPSYDKISLEYQKLKIDINDLIKENKKLKSELTKNRRNNEVAFVAKPSSFSESETRKMYIDFMLIDAGWKKNSNWVDEVKVPLRSSPSRYGYIDYVLYDDSQIPLAIIEAKKIGENIAKARYQAKQYADELEELYGRRPIIFISNGYETRIIDGQYPERVVSSIYSKNDLEKIFNLRSMRLDLKNITVDKYIAGRYYQIQAVKAVCESFERNRRKALLVMATGSGKTRTVIALVDILLNRGWIKNILFLADRTGLVTQAKRSFVNLLPNLSVVNLAEKNPNFLSHAVFSTYQTMYNVIDDARTEEGRIFTPGHFDLVICDEAHRSIYNKYKDIFTYFDAPLVGLTATPKDEISRNTYDFFDLEHGQPTFGYDLRQAVKDGYLVDYKTVEVKTKFLSDGIYYDQLSEEEKENYENLFIDDSGQVIDKIESSALYSWLFNKDTIRKVINTVMQKSLKIHYGQKIGKTIIFAKNHNHAKAILDIFHKEFPEYPEYADIIVHNSTNAQSLIDDFSDPNKLPQIAISVDMLDTGIDIPEILNLVFFKKVKSKAKFWQMIGRGTRLCPNLIDGKDKEYFYIFDFCSNFEFFRISEGTEIPASTSLESRLFMVKLSMVFEINKIIGRSEELRTFRSTLVNDLIDKVMEINTDNFAASQHIEYLEKAETKEFYDALQYIELEEMEEHIAPYLVTEKDDYKAQLFDYFIYCIELDKLLSKSTDRKEKKLIIIVKQIYDIDYIPDINCRRDFIDQLISTDYIQRAGISGLEKIRIELRDLIKYIQYKTKKIKMINIIDEILDIEEKESEFTDDYLEDYKIRVEQHIRKNQENELAIYKIRHNKKLNSGDIQSLERILWLDLGTKEDYIREYGEKPLGEFVREIVGLDMNAAKEAFSTFLMNSTLNESQIYFINTVIEYIVQNGLVKDRKVLNETPFTDRGNVVDLFGDNMNTWYSFLEIINTINANVAV